MQTPPLKGNEHLYNLQGQLNHKIDFINRHIPKDVKVYLIGHSIGAKLCLDLLKTQGFSHQVQHCYLLFPTIERMAESSNGKLVPTYDKFSFLFRIFYKSFHWLPESWKRAIVSKCCRSAGVADDLVEPTMSFINPLVIDRLWFLTLDEMDKVRDLDEQLFKENVHRIKIYYAVLDAWVPQDCYNKLINRFPGADAIKSMSHEHAFVLKSSVAVGVMVSEWIRLERIIKNKDH